VCERIQRRIAREQPAPSSKRPRAPEWEAAARSRGSGSLRSARCATVRPAHAVVAARGLLRIETHAQPPGIVKAFGHLPAKSLRLRRTTLRDCSCSEERNLSTRCREHASGHGGRAVAGPPTRRTCCRGLLLRERHVSQTDPRTTRWRARVSPERARKRKAATWAVWLGAASTRALIEERIGRLPDALLQRAAGAAAAGLLFRKARRGRSTPHISDKRRLVWADTMGPLRLIPHSGSSPSRPAPA